MSCGGHHAQQDGAPYAMASPRPSPSSSCTPDGEATRGSECESASLTAPSRAGTKSDTGARCGEDKVEEDKVEEDRSDEGDGAETKAGCFRARVCSMDFGELHMALLFADVCARSVTGKQMKEAQDGTLCTQGEPGTALTTAEELVEPSDDELRAAPPFTVTLSGHLIVTLHVRRWQLFNLHADGHADGSSILPAAAGTEGTATETRIRGILFAIVNNGHLDRLLAALVDMDTELVLLEQQVGPRPGSEGNPAMFNLFHALWAILVWRIPRFRARPPATVGPSASLQTCALLQKSAAFARSGAAAMLPLPAPANRGGAGRPCKSICVNSLTGRRQYRKKFKKDQVVHFVDWLVRWQKTAAARLYWAAGDKRDDLSDTLVQILSFLRNSVAPGLRRERVDAAKPARAAKITKATDTARSSERPRGMKRGFEETKGGGRDDTATPDRLAMLCRPSRTHSAVNEPGVPPCLQASQNLHCVYLLYSKTARSTYIGYSPNVGSRVRQHTGEKAGGAKFTRRASDWVPIQVLSGFQTAAIALSFESAWQGRSPSLARPDSKTAVCRLDKTLPSCLKTRLNKCGRLLQHAFWKGTAPTLAQHWLSAEWARPALPAVLVCPCTGEPPTTA